MIGIEGTEPKVKPLFRRLVEASVVLSIDADGMLAIDAPKGVMTDELVAELRAHRDDLLALVEHWTERAAVREYAGGMSRPKAERVALIDVIGGGDPAALKADPADASEPLDLGPWWSCPWCRRGDRLADCVGGLRCYRCGRLAWRWVGDSMERCDFGDLIEVEPPAMVEAVYRADAPEPKRKRAPVVDAAERLLFDPAIESG